MSLPHRPYLQSLIDDRKYQQKWGFYTPTDAIGRLPEQAATGLDIGLMVQLMQPQQSEAQAAQASERQEKEQQEKERQEKTERLPVLEGIRKYAPEHVLLMGRPGSGKSTALLRLLLDEARNALSDPAAKMPVLMGHELIERQTVLELKTLIAFKEHPSRFFNDIS